MGLSLPGMKLLTALSFVLALALAALQPAPVRAAGGCPASEAAGPVCMAVAQALPGRPAPDCASWPAILPGADGPVPPQAARPLARRAGSPVPALPGARDHWRPPRGLS